MSKKPKNSDKPKRFFNSINDPGYKNAELEYCLNAKRSRNKHKKGIQRIDQPPDIDRIKMASDILKIFRRVWPSGYIGAPELSTIQEIIDEDRLFEIVKYAVITWGLDAVRPPWNEEIENRNLVLTRSKIQDNQIPNDENTSPYYEEVLSELGAAVCGYLRFLSSEAVSPDLNGRKKAVQRLRKILNIFIPSTKGKRNTYTPGQVRMTYYKELFRLHQIQNAIRSPTGPRNPDKKVAEVSKNFEMSKEQIRDFFMWTLYFDMKDHEDYEQKSLRDKVRIPIKETAVHLTAMHYGITNHAVANILARKR